MSTLEKQIVDHGFTMVPNEIRDHKNLSFKAKGIWTYIWGKPEGWDFAVKRIANDSNEGVKSITSGVKELEDAGYLTRTRLKGGRVVYKVYAILALRGSESGLTAGGRSPEARNDTLPKRQSVETGEVSNKDYKKYRDKENEFSNENSAPSSLVVKDLEINKDDDVQVVAVDENGEEPTVDRWGNPIGEKKKVKREGKNKIALRIQHKFVEKCKKEIGTAPVMNIAGYKMVLYALNAGLKEEHFDDLFEDWFGAGASDEETIQITRALSTVEINKFKVREGIK